MSSVDDWAAKAARKIFDETDCPAMAWPSEEHIAAIIATFAEPLVALLIASKREHSGTYQDEANDHPPCPKWSNLEDYETDEPCTCGADDWNRRVDEALGGMK